MAQTTSTQGTRRQTPRERAQSNAVARRLEQLDVGSDEALELTRVCFVNAVGNHRIESLQATVIAAWAAQLASVAMRGVTHLDRNEILAEARLWLIEQLKEFRPSDDGGNIGAFIRTRQTWFRSDTRRSSGGHLLTHGQFAALGALGRVREEHMSKHHCEPSSAELRSRVTSLLHEQARTKILDKPDGSGLMLSEEDLATAVHRRLSKDGVIAAIDDLDTLRLESLPELALQVLDSDDDTPNWGVPLPSVAGPDIDEDDPEQDYQRLLLVALGDHQWARTAFGLRAGDAPSGADSEPGALTLRELADQADHSVGELRDVLAQARVRAGAPHAHFAYLADYAVKRG